MFIFGQNQPGNLQQPATTMALLPLSNSIHNDTPHNLHPYPKKRPERKSSFQRYSLIICNSSRHRGRSRSSCNSGQQQTVSERALLNTQMRNFSDPNRKIIYCILLLVVGISSAQDVSLTQLRSRNANKRLLLRNGNSPGATDDGGNYGNGEYEDDSKEGVSSGSSSGGYPSSSSAYGDYGVYTPKGSSTSGSSGGSSSISSSSGYGYDSYDSYGSSSSLSSSSSYEWGSSSKSSSLPSFKMPELQLSIIPAIFLIMFVTVIGMLITAYQMEHSPEGTFANCCRISLTTVSCIYRVIFNLYHCRLGEIPQVVFASEFENDDELTDEELERMKLRPGIERALDVEHRKALRKVGIEMNKIKVGHGVKQSGTGLSAGVHS